MMKSKAKPCIASSDRLSIDHVAYLDLLRRRPIVGADRVGAPSSVRRRAFARAMAEIRSYVPKSGAGGVQEPASHGSLCEHADAGSRR
jgi:hypothetical protein